MTSAANNQPYGSPNWTNATGGPGSGPPNAGPYNNGPWNGNGPWGGPWGHRFWGMMPPWMPPHAAKPLFIVAMILGFVFWWPVGLVLLGVMLWNKRAFCGYRRYGGGWQGNGNGGANWGGWKNRSGGPGMGGGPSSGNRAFDDYKAETLRRLEDEQKEFAEFLDRLRVAKDKAEFDQFMNDRRSRPEAPPAAPPAQA